MRRLRFMTVMITVLFTSIGSIFAQDVIWEEDFESVTQTSLTSSATTIGGLSGWSYEKTNQGRLRFNHTAMSGSAAATMDVSSSDLYAQNYLIVEIPLGEYALADDLKLSFSYMDHGDENSTDASFATGDYVWARYSNDPAVGWIPIYYLQPGSRTNGVWNSISDLDISALLIDQVANSVLQIRFGQYDNYPANTTTASDGITFDDIRLTGTKPPPTIYSYQSGNWNDPNTWTTDKSGRTRVGSRIPQNGDRAIILEGRTIDLTANISETNLSLRINEGAILNLKSFQFNEVLDLLDGQGTLIIEDSYFPTVIDNQFVEKNGGTTEYRLLQNKRLPTNQSVFNHFILNSDFQATQRHNITINGNFNILKGKYRISNNSDVNRYQLSILGNVVIASGAQWFVAEGNTFNGLDEGGIANAPFTNYYDQNTHRVVINGNFTNHGTVKFTNLAYPVYNAFPNQGAATVYFMGNSNSLLYCNGQTDFYNLILDKGIDQTFSLTVHPTAYQNFRIFGRNDLQGDKSNGDNSNPILRKALWIRTGSLILKGLATIPSLSEGDFNNDPDGTANADYFIPAKGALILDGSEVIVLSSADRYEEVNIAYGVNGGTGEINGVGKNYSFQSLSIYGKLEVNDGYLSTRESGGLITWAEAAGKLSINGGTIDAKQYRAAGDEGLSSYLQTGGKFILRGLYQLNTSGVTTVHDLKNAPLNLSESQMGLEPEKGTFNLNNDVNSFTMSGGTIEILNDCDLSNTKGNAIIDVFALPKNINVTGGNINIHPQSGTGNMLIRSAAPFYNLTLENKGSANRSIQLAEKSTTVAGHLEVKNKLQLTKGGLIAGAYNVSVGGDFVIEAAGEYSGTNTTIFNGTKDQQWINNSANTLAIHNLEITKPADKTVSLDGSISEFTVNNTTTLTLGKVNTNGKTLNLKGNIENNGIFMGSGNVALNGTSNQTIGGNNNGQFTNVQLNNAIQEIRLAADIQINGNLQFVANKSFNIDKYELYLSTGASISGYNSNCYIKSAGNAGDGGLKLAANTSSNFFPIGVGTYTPATIGFNTAPSTVGTLNVVPVNYEHTTTSTNNQALNYFWRVKSEGFTGIDPGSVTHNFKYTESLVPSSDANYVPAVFFIDNATQSFDWHKGTETSVDASTNTITDWNTPTVSGNFLDGDYTAGPTNAFGTPQKFYSRRTGNWNSRWTWSNTGHSGSSASRIPTYGDIVIIGNGNTINLLNNGNTYPQDYDIRHCAVLQIENGSTLDIKSNTASTFGMVLSHPNGNGLFRLTTEKASRWNRPQFFQFPGGDFTDFNKNQGTTEFYDIDGTSGALYILPADVTEYGNLLLRARGGDNIVLPNNNKTVINGDLTCTGNQDIAWIAMSWNTNFGDYNNSTAYDPTIEKTVQINGNLNIEAGTFMFMADKAAQHLIVKGNINVEANGNIEVNDGYPFNTVRNNTLTVGGSINNKNTVLLKNGNHYCDIFFNSENNAEVGGNGQYTFNNITINKGSSQNNIVTFNSSGTLTVPNSHWLTLKNGTFRYERNANININPRAELDIPATAALHINTNNKVTIANNGASDDDVFLSGKILLEKGELQIGGSTDNDIEYSSGGLSEIEILTGTLTVSGQIRRNPSTSAGVLKYKQTGGTATIQGNNAIADNAKFEILNPGSSFIMSGGSIRISRGGGTTFGDVYLRPEIHNVSGGTIELTSPDINQNQNYLLEATCPLNNLTINGNENDIARVQLMVSPLKLNGNLNISNEYSAFDANTNMDIDVFVKGNYTNNGTYNHYKNTTTFNGNSQTIDGSSELSFFNMNVNSISDVNLAKNITVENDLSINSGNLACATNTLSLNRNLHNAASYTASTGAILMNGTNQQSISGTGLYGNTILNNKKGAKLLNAITFEGDLTLNMGVLDINTYLLTLGSASDILGAPFSINNMIMSDGVYSNVGVLKNLPSGENFTLPLGVPGKYTPAQINCTSNGGITKVRLNNINSRHPSTIDANNVLQYFWEIEAEGVSNFIGNISLNYLDQDIAPDLSNETNYIGARLLIPNTNWSKPGGAINHSNNTINFNFNGTDNISGEYTAGTDIAIPNNIPEYTSSKNGLWADETVWVQTGGDVYACPAEGPNGFIVNIDHEITINSSNVSSYKTFINNKLIIDKSHSGHNLGNVYGNGTLSLQTGLLPEGRYSSFLTCGSNSTLEYGGSDDYTIIADLYSTISNVLFTGSGSRNLPNKDLTICKQMLINDANVTVNNSNNKTLFIKGSLQRTAGTFISGSGTNATIVFNGDSKQQLAGNALGNFTGINALNNLKINNANGLELGTLAEVELKGNLYLTNGTIKTSSTQQLKLTNISENCVFPAGGSANSYVDGPLQKLINQGDGFNFPIGKDGTLGNKMSTLSTQSGASWFTGEYFTPNPTSANYAGDLTYVNADEYWKVSALQDKKGIVQIKWDAESDLTPLMCANGTADMRVVKLDEISGKWIEQNSTASGTNSSGSVKSIARLTIPASGFFSVTTASVNDIKPRAKLSPAGAICGTAGIPVSFTSSPGLDYILEYTVNGNPLSVNIATSNYVLPTPVAGEYKLTSFKYDFGNKNGVVDLGSVMVYDIPTQANAGTDISLCGASNVALNANSPNPYDGLWTLLSGTGRVDAPSNAASQFYGNNGDSYELEWRITNGECFTKDTVKVTFPVMAQQPSFTQSKATVCQNEEKVIYTVSEQSSASFIWSFSGTGAQLTDNGNSIELSFLKNATSGTLEVNAKNSCNTSSPSSLAITVNEAPKPLLSSDDSDNLICSGSDIKFTGAAGTAIGINNYEFFTDGVSSQNGATNQYTASGLSGTHEIYVLGTSNQSCKGISDTITVKASDQIWQGTNNSDWYTMSNWACAALPTDLTDLIVPASATRMPVIDENNGSGAQFRNIEIENTATLTLAGTSTLDVYGNWLNEGSLISNQGSINFTGNSTISGNSTLDFHNINIKASSSLTSSNGSVNVSGNLVNNGNFNNNSGTIAFTGSALQQVDGDFNGTNAFNNFTINNAAGIELVNGTKKVDGQLTFTDGKIQSNSLLILDENATTNISAASGPQTSYVVGSLKKEMVGNINGSFFFPVGTATEYKPAGISELNGYGTTSVWEVLYNPNIATSPIATGEPIIKVSATESWTIRSNVGEAKVTLWWNKLQNGDLYIDPDRLDEIKIAHLTNNGWVDFGNSNPTGAGSAYGTVTSASTIVFDGLKSTNGPEEFTFASTTSAHPLPVVLTSFSGKATEEAIELFWTTGSELNNDYFELQRSIDGINFNTIDKISGNGTSYIEIQYQAEDVAPIEGINYYRLKQVDYDGKEEIHPIIAIEWNGNYGNNLGTMSGFNLYPNPYKQGELNLELQNKSLLNTDVTLSISDISGKQIFSKKVHFEDPVLILTDFTQGLFSKGVYQITLQTPNSRTTKKLIIQ